MKDKYDIAQRLQQIEEEIKKMRKDIIDFEGQRRSLKWVMGDEK